MTDLKLTNTYQCIRFLLDECLYLIEENRIVIYSEKKEKQNYEINYAEFIGKYKDCIILKNDFGEGYILDAKKNICKRITNDDLCFGNNNWNNLIPVYKSKSIFDPVENGLYDIETDRLLFKRIDCYANDFIQDIFIGIFNEILFCNCKITGAELWSFSFSQINSFAIEDGNMVETELVSIIGVYKKVIWILVTNRKFIGLDLEKGILLYEIDLCKELGLKPDTTENFSFSIKDVHLDNENGIIKSLSYRYYWHLDLNTLKAEIKKDFGENPKESWRINRSKYYLGDKNLYFIGTNKGEVVNRAVGIFDTEILEVVWYDNPLEEKKYLFFTNAPQINNKTLGVLDSENNLRVYERD